MRILVVSPVRAVSEALSRMLQDSVEVEVAAVVVRSPREMKDQCREGAIMLVDSSLISRATWLDVHEPSCIGVQFIFFGIGSGMRDLCFCRCWRAEGLVGEGATLDELAEAAKRILDGQFYISPSAVRVIRSSALTSRSETKQALLTKREREVANLITFGGSNSSIAHQLGISVETARIHVKHILRKLHAVTRNEIGEAYASYVAAEYESVCETLTQSRN